MINNTPHKSMNVKIIFEQQLNNNNIDNLIFCFKKIVIGFNNIILNSMTNYLSNKPMIVKIIK